MVPMSSKGDGKSCGKLGKEPLVRRLCLKHLTFLVTKIKGEIYSGRDINSNKLVAIKVERVDSKKQVLKLEVAVLKKLQSRIS